MEKEQQIEILLTRIEDLRDSIGAEVGSSTMDLIDELVEVELQAEELCNK